MIVDKQDIHGYLRDNMILKNEIVIYYVTLITKVITQHTIHSLFESNVIKHIKLLHTIHSLNKHLPTGVGSSFSYSEFSLKFGNLAISITEVAILLYNTLYDYGIALK